MSRIFICTFGCFLFTFMMLLNRYRSDSEIAGYLQEYVQSEDHR